MVFMFVLLTHYSDAVRRLIYSTMCHLSFCLSVSLFVCHDCIVAKR